MSLLIITKNIIGLTGYGINISIEFSGFDQIKLSSDDILCILCRSQKQNSVLYNQKIKESFENIILSKINDSKIYLKSIKIPQDIYAKLKIERRPYFPMKMIIICLLG